MSEGEYYTLDPYMIGLAERALDSKHWSIHPPEATRQKPYRNSRGILWVREYQPWGPWLPDLTDDATVGCLLGLVRSVFDDESICTACASPDEEKRWEVECWAPDLTRLPFVSYLTEAEALIAALEFAEETQRKL